MITAKQLTAEEKLRLICGKDCWHTEGLGGKLTELFVSDGPVGLRTVRVVEDSKEETIPAVGYPSVQILANTWSRQTARETGECLADDCIERGVDILLAPGVNIKRHPLNGRNFEYFSEDLYLAGTLAKEYIAGVQECGVGACLKHFCCNNLEYDRLHQTSDVDERTLRELYYVPFEIACEVKPVSAMCSYNRVNGTYASEYKKGFDILRGEFGFDGDIFSDWEAVRDRTAAAKAGLDIEMPFNQKNYEALCEDYRAGKLTDEELDACAQRVINLVFRCKNAQKNARVRRTESERAKSAQRVAAEGMVLLQNGGILPLAKGASIAVIGCYAKPDTIDMLQGGGSSCVEWLNRSFDLPAQLEKRGFSVFGHGLSYASFLYKNLQLKATEDGLEVSYKIENTSAQDGKEVSQVYVRECAPLVYRPKKELKAYAKTYVAAGCSAQETHTLGKRAFAHWSAANDAWEVTDGVYEIMVGASVSDIRLSAKIRVEGGKVHVL